MTTSELTTGSTWLFTEIVSESEWTPSLSVKVAVTTAQTGALPRLR